MKNHLASTNFCLRYVLVFACAITLPFAGMQAYAQSAFRSDRPIQTESALWTIHDSTQAHTVSITTLGISQASVQGFEKSATGFTIRPIVDSRERLFQFTAANRDTWNSDLDAGFKLKQVVPGLPEDERFSDKVFDPVKKGFSAQCSDSAKKYREAFYGLAQSEHLSAALNSGIAESASAAYEQRCLVALSDVPEQIRQVAGVLSVAAGGAWAPFCSATIIDQRALVTSRHCFFDADSGKSLVTWKKLIHGDITFHSFAKHNGQTVFSARANNPEGESVNPYFAYDDTMQIRVIEGPFEHWAIATGVQPNEVPLTLWVVGTNELLGDILKSQNPLALVRAASPNACAVVATTPLGCLYHSCQTGHSTSGAGLLFLADNNVHIVGVHKGPLARGSRCEPAAPVELDLNLAAALR